MINPKSEQLRGIEINGLLALYENDFIKHVNALFGDIQKKSSGTVNCIRIFDDLPPSWVGREVSVYGRPVGKTPSLEFHQPCLNKIRSIVKNANRGNMMVLIALLNNCSARERRWLPKYYSDEWWGKYHVKLINKLWEELNEYNDGILWEVCNEGTGGKGWEIRAARFLRNLGCNYICSSPAKDFNAIKNEGIFDFLVVHGIWMKDRFNVNYKKYQGEGFKIAFSGDGWSDLEPEKGGSRFCQFNKCRPYGRLPTPRYNKRLLMRCMGNHFFYNASGGIEIPDPHYEHFFNVLRGFREAIICSKCEYYA